MTPIQTYTVELENFHGPLDLLLSLIERNELEITDVSVGQVTNDYLKTVTALEKVQDQELSWFLDVATRLIFHKARALSQESAEAEEAGELAELTRELARYKIYRELANQLAKQLCSPLLTREQPAQETAFTPKNLTLTALQQAYRNARLMHRETAEKPTHTVHIKRTDITRTMHHLLTKAKTKLALREVFTASHRRTLTLSLLALLELAKQHKIELIQSGNTTYVQAI